MTWAHPWKVLRTSQQGDEGSATIHRGREAGGVAPGRLPAFVVAGPPRTGTSWLHEVLQPHAHLPGLTKETRFFDLHYARGLDWYRGHFPVANDGRPAGEIAPTYFASPTARDRIAQAMPHVQLVFIFRHPVQRLVSLYRLKKAYGLVSWSLEGALEKDPELMGSSRYAEHLAGWQRRFPAEQIHVTLYDDLQRDPQSFVNQIADFLGMPRFLLKEGSVEDLHPHASARMTEPKWYLATRAATHIADWCKGRNLDGLVARVRNSKLNELFLGSGAAFPEIPRETKERIGRLLLPETEKLEALLGRDLSAWKRLPE
jgi:LPS sulfotransferase NodH